MNFNKIVLQALETINNQSNDLLDYKSKQFNNPVVSMADYKKRITSFETIENKRKNIADIVA